MKKGSRTIFARASASRSAKKTFSLFSFPLANALPPGWKSIFF